MLQKIKLIFLISLIIILPGFGFKCTSKEVQQYMKPIELNYWRVWDGPDAFAEIIDKYNQLHSNIAINYKKLRYDEYEQALLEAWAEDRGPDIFSIHNTWVKKYQSKIETMPPNITMAYPIVKGTMKKEIVPEIRVTKSISLKDIKDKFVDVVYDDVVINIEGREQVFGLPISMDTLAMYYHKDLLNNANITMPPAYWDREFQQNVKKLTRQNTKGEIIQSGVALGGSDNVERYSDILSVLMMQNGAVMMNEAGAVMFNQAPPAYSEQKYNPGMEALRFYTDFANPAKEVYCWNNDLDNSLEMFTQGKLAFMFGYAYHLPQIRAQGPKLNFSIAPLPQIEDSQQIINFANYWVETVSKKSQHSDEAWDFIQFISRAENVKSYLKAVNKPTALRSLIEEQLDDVDIGVFADQVLTAKSWYKGADVLAAENVIGEMINDVVTGKEEIDSAINTGASRVRQTVVK